MVGLELQLSNSGQLGAKGGDFDFWCLRYQVIDSKGLIKLNTICLYQNNSKTTTKVQWSSYIQTPLMKHEFEIFKVDEGIKTLHWFLLTFNDATSYLDHKYFKLNNKSKEINVMHFDSKIQSLSN